MTASAWSPRYTLSPAIASGLMQIEAALARVRAAHPSRPEVRAQRASKKFRRDPHRIYIFRNVFTMR
jgi:hypothetical protein